MPRIADQWEPGPAPDADELDQVVYLSNRIGLEPRLVQPGGGNTSVKVGSELLVKGSGTDLRTIGRRGFTRLSLPSLAALRSAETMDDAEMMRFMASCMTEPDAPAPSVETPLHSLLPAKVIAHTHDVATMSVTNVDDALAARLIDELFGGEIVYVPYVRPGFPLAKSVSRMVDTIPSKALGMALAHHGLVVWADEPRECYARLIRAINCIEDYLATRRFATSSTTRRAPDSAAETVLPVVRGALGSARRVVLHLDATVHISDAMVDVVQRGMATPEHILRAGRRPLWLDLDFTGSAEGIAEGVRSQIAAQRAEYEAYHARNATHGEQPLDDWAKVVLAPGLGMITAGRDKKGAVTANLCYRATLQAITNAEAIDRFQFIPESDVFAFEHWPLERRKIDEQDARERATLLLSRHVAIIIGGGSGIGRAAALRFAREGAHVVVADIDRAAAEAVAAEVKGLGAVVDVRDDASVAALIRQTVLEFGGVDSLFYTAGQAPRFAGVTDIRREDLQRQLDIHYIGAVLAIGGVAAVMRRQGLGGAIVGSVSKAALAPGKDAVAYGGSKAALLQAMRVAAVELGPDGIRVNAINADQIETPMFMKFVEERAAMRGLSVDEQLEAYRRRNVMGVSLIPAEAVADLAALMASERFRYTTGDIITVDGGLPEAFPR